MTLESLKAAILQLPEADCYALSELCKQQGDTLKEQRQQKAKLDAIALLENAGLSVADLGKVAKSKSAKKKESPYKDGVPYAHPDDLTKIWQGHGKPPAWIKELEAQGRKPVIRPQVANQEMKKAG